MKQRRRRRFPENGVPAKVLTMNGSEYIPRKEAEEKSIKLKGELKTVLSTLAASHVSRSDLMAYLGKSFGGARNLYNILGYPKILRFSHYETRYKRQEVAKAAVDRPVEGSWLKRPKIADSENPENASEFEKAWVKLEKEHRLYSYLIRADKLSSLGQYGIILFGFDDGRDLSKPLTQAKKLIYLQVFSEDNARITKWDENQRSERYGKPDTYELRIYTKDGSSTRTVAVHHSRIQHIVHDPLESDIFGTPKLQAVYNRLQDLETLSGGSAEMYWKGARPGYALEIDPDYTFDETDKQDLTDELQEFDHELRRMLRLKGIKMKSLEPQVKEPLEFINPILDLIAAGVNMPKRILIGSERGELASSQDRANWHEQMEARRKGYVENMILRPFIDKMIDLGILPSPQKDEYVVNWAEFDEPGERAITENAKRAAEALAAYANSPGAELIIPPDEFLQRWLGYSKQEADEILKRYEDILGDEDLLADVIKGSEPTPQTPAGPRRSEAGDDA